MKFIYKPEGTEEPDWKTWEFDPDKLMSPEAEAIERLTGFTYSEWGDAVSRGSMAAIHGLLYVMLKRENPTLKYDSVVFCLAEIDFEVDDEESAEIRATLEQRVEAGEVLAEDDAALLERLKADEAAPKEEAAPAPESSDAPSMRALSLSS